MGKLMLDGVEVGLPDRSVTAGGVSYDNTTSGLSATDVQGAVDEVATIQSVSVTAQAIYSSGKVELKKVGHLVNFRARFRTSNAISANSWVNLFSYSSLGLGSEYVFGIGMAEVNSDPPIEVIIYDSYAMILCRGSSLAANTQINFNIAFLV